MMAKERKSSGMEPMDEGVQGFHSPREGVEGGKGVGEQGPASKGKQIEREGDLGQEGDIGSSGEDQGRHQGGSLRTGRAQGGLEGSILDEDEENERVGRGGVGGGIEEEDEYRGELGSHGGGAGGGDTGQGGQPIQKDNRGEAVL